jgi:hypothetical protein
MVVEAYDLVHALQHLTATTGDGFYAECQMLCRVSFIGHSVKRLFAERCSRPSKTLGKDRFTECWALGKEMHSASLCREPSSRQRFTLDKDDLTNGKHPTVTLCRVSAVRHSIKFFLIILPSARNLTLCKEFLCRVSESWHSAKNFNFFSFCT